MLYSEKVKAKNDLTKLKAEAVPDEYNVLACLQKYDVELLKILIQGLDMMKIAERAERVYIAVTKEYKDLTRIFTEEQMEELREIQ